MKLWGPYVLQPKSSHPNLYEYFLSVIQNDQHHNWNASIVIQLELKNQFLRK